MKRKFLILTLCFTILFSSINIKKSYANPIVGKVAEVSIIYGIGRIALDMVGFVGNISDVMQLGTSIYNKMNDQQKKDVKESINYDKDGFTYDKNKIESSISDYLPSKGYHYLKPFEVEFNPKHYIGTSSIGSSFSDIWEKHSITYTYQGIKFRTLTYSYPISDTISKYTFYYSIDGLAVQSQQFNAITGRDQKIVLYMGDSVGTYYNFMCSYHFDGIKKDYFLSTVNSSCVNCPHDEIVLKDRYDYPSLDDLEYIESNYPQYENDIPDLIEQGGNVGNGSTGGNTPDLNNPIITNPPKFPNLEEFNFNGLELEPLTNLFSNFKTKFPFSLPFDLANLISSLNQDSIPPIFEVDLFGESMTLDLTQFTELANILKAFTILGYLVSLILLTKRFGG